MLIKVVTCVVPDGKREAFSTAQEAWRALHGLDGFRGQAGGWDETDPGVAVIVALWRDEPAYRAFMDRVHDTIVEPSGQAATWAAITVRLCRVRIEIPGGGDGFASELHGAESLRVADCVVRPGRMAHFEAMQRKVWNPGMAAAGMLAGLFCATADDPARRIVLTLWSTVEAHRAYRDSRLATLRERAGAARDLREIAGRRIRLRPAWSAGAAGQPL